MLEMLHAHTLGENRTRFGRLAATMIASDRGHDSPMRCSEFENSNLRFSHLTAELIEITAFSQLAAKRQQRRESWSGPDFLLRQAHDRCRWRAAGSPCTNFTATAFRRFESPRNRHSPTDRARIIKKGNRPAPRHWSRDGQIASQVRLHQAGCREALSGGVACTNSWSRYHRVSPTLRLC